MVERQPLGRRLFEDYCREQLHYKNWIEFLEMVNQYELSITDKKQIAEQIRKEFLAPDALRLVSFDDHVLLLLCLSDASPTVSTRARWRHV